MTRRHRPPPDPADAPAFRAAREVCRRHGKNFYFASAFLPPAKRNAAHAVYAFCRMVGDAVDVAEEEGVATGTATGAALRHRPLSVSPVTSSMAGCCSSDPLGQRLSWFRDRLNDLYDGRLELPSVQGRSEEQHVLHAFSAAARRYQIPRQHLLDLAEARRMEQSVVRYATWSSLDRYCQHAGGAAALAAGCVLGLTSSGAAEHAIAAGKAIAFTRILANLKRDMAGGRIYLPLEDLAAFRYGERDLTAGVVNDNFSAMMRFQVERARRLYRDAADGLRWVAGDGSRFAASTLLAWESGVLDVIERHGYDVFRSPPALRQGQKLRRLALAWRLSRRGPATQVQASETPAAEPFAAAR